MVIIIITSRDFKFGYLKITEKLYPKTNKELQITSFSAPKPTSSETLFLFKCFTSNLQLQELLQTRKPPKFTMQSNLHCIIKVLGECRK